MIEIKSNKGITEMQFKGKHYELMTELRSAVETMLAGMAKDEKLYKAFRKDLIRMIKKRKYHEVIENLKYKEKKEHEEN